MVRYDLNITGSDLSGSSGATSRTYTLPNSNVTDVGMLIFVDGTPLHRDTDYSVSSNVITFVNAVWDDSNIDGVYYTTVGETSSDLGYVTNLSLSRFMGLVATIPNVDSTARENVGTGDNSATSFWLDKLGVISGTYTLYSGATEAASTALTETTHYTIDLETSEITLTAAGVTQVSTDNIYAKYSYNSAQITDQQVTDAITRAEKQVDDFTNNHFADGTDATPNWNAHSDEEQDGKGVFDRNYFTLQNYPIPDVSTTLNGAVSADDTTITVTSTNGFPSSGSILIGSDKIAYTGKTSTTFTGCTSVSAHSNGATVKAYVVEISTTDPGGSITWDVLTEGTEFELDRKTGRIHLYADGGYYFGRYYDDFSTPPDGVANRFRISYLSGVDTIPEDIKKATLMIASHDLMKMSVRHASANGLNDFKPGQIHTDKEEYEKILSNYRNEQYGRV